VAGRDYETIAQHVSGLRFITRWSAVGLAALAVAAGCGGNSKNQALAAGDLRRITFVRPTTPGWGWPLKPVPPAAPPGRDDPSVKAPARVDPLDKAIDRQLAKAGSEVASEGSRWQDEEKLGVTHAVLLKSAAGAHTVLAAERAYARGWAKRFVDGGHFTDGRVEGLGEEGWRIQSDFPTGQEVTYGWRRATLVLQIHIQCIFQTCPSDIRRAGRAWADAIDRKARTSQ
jgi:hypothetical protein